MRRFGWGLAIALTLTTTSVVFAQPNPNAAEVENAKRAFEDGVNLEKKNDYAAALAKFRESAQIKATLGNRFHIAYCLEMTGALASALSEYEAVEKTALATNKKEIVDQTQTRLEPLRKRVPQLTFQIQPPPPKEGIAGMEVLVDGKAVVAIDKAERVDPGEHVITAHAPDYENFTKKITVAEGSTTAVDVLLPKRGGGNAAATTPASNGSTINAPSSDAPITPSGKSHTLAIATTAGAVALTTVGVVTFILAGSAQSDAESTCPTKTTCEDERSKVRTLDTVSLATLIGGVGLGALSVVLWLSPGSSATASSSTSSTSTRLVAKPSWIGLERHF